VSLVVVFVVVVVAAQPAHGLSAFVAALPAGARQCKFVAASGASFRGR
jgi:hypothetical protein